MCSDGTDLGERFVNQFKLERGRTQRRGDVTDDLLRIHPMLDADRHLQLSDDRRLHHGRVELVVQLYHRDDAHEQLRQPLHLRGQVPRVPDGRQTPAPETGG